MLVIQCKGTEICGHLSSCQGLVAQPLSEGICIAELEWKQGRCVFWHCMGTNKTYLARPDPVQG